MKAAVLALGFVLIAGTAACAGGSTHARHAPTVVPSSSVRCAAIIGAKHPRSPVQRPRRIYRPRHGDFGFF